MKFMRVFLAVAVTAIASACCGVDAFWERGHLLVAEIARQHLLSPKYSGSGGKKIVDALDSYARYLVEQGFPTCGNTFDATGSYVSCASWPDDIKSYTYSQSPWHFWNEPYFSPSNFDAPRVQPGTHGCPLSSQSSVGLLDGFAKTLKLASSSGPKFSAYFSSFAMAYYVHVTGDLHQPLHNTQLFSPAQPTGDEGGNRIPVSCPQTKTDTNCSSITELHAYFDAVCGTMAGYISRPLTPSSNEWLVSNAARLIRQYPLSQQEEELSNVTAIALEAYELGVTYAYHYANGSLVQNGDVLDAAFQQRCLPVMERQLARGGARLARQLALFMNESVAVSSGSSSWFSVGSFFFGVGITTVLALVVVGLAWWKCSRRLNAEDAVEKTRLTAEDEEDRGPA
jgi:hypothetical protein